MPHTESTSPPTFIRKAQLGDAHEISQLIIRSINFFHGNTYTAEALAIWRRGYTPTKIKAHLLHRQNWVLEVGDELGGIIQFDPPEIKGFYIHPTYRGRGYGRKILQHLLDNVATAGYKQVELTSNKLVVGFYEKQGFDMVGEELVYWEDYPFVEYRMVKRLGMAEEN